MQKVIFIILSVVVYFPSMANDIDIEKIKSQIQGLQHSLKILENQLEKIKLHTNQSANKEENNDNKNRNNCINNERKSITGNLHGWVTGPLPENKNKYNKNFPSYSSPLTKSEALKKTKTDYSNGLDFLNQGNIKKAKDSFQAVKQNSDDYAQALYWLGMIAMFQEQNYAESSTLFSKSFQAYKGTDKEFIVSILLKMSESLFYQGKLSAAQIVLDECKEKANGQKLSPDLAKEIEALHNRLRKT